MADVTRADLDADMIARAVFAAATSFGDDPILALTGARSERRSLPPAADALGRVFGLSDWAAQGLFGLAGGSLFNRRNAPNGREAFERASRVAEDVVRHTLAARRERQARERGGATDVAPLAAAPPIALALSAPAPVAPLPKTRARMAAPSVTTPLDRLPDAAPVTQPSSRSGTRTAGKPADPARAGPRARAPLADLPPRAEDRSGESFELRRVHELRGKGVPWPHIARQIGKSIPDTRRRYDPEYRDA